MDEHPNPRNRTDPQLILSTPLRESSSSAAAASATRSLTTNTASPFEPLRSASDPRNLAVHSKKNTVLLCDWWLLLAPEVHEGRRLSVGGVVAERYRGSSRHEGDRSGSKFLLSPWQKAERVFESAPITKRYDSFTLGTADGITVRIQGVINKARSHQNGIPLEVCNLFLIGFPYNWNNYAGPCFEGKFNSASVPESAASANELSEGCLFPVHLDDFSLSRIHDGSVDGSVTRKFRDFLERFCYTTKPVASDVHNCTLPLVESCLPHEPPSKYERAIVHTQANSESSSSLADGVITENFSVLTSEVQQNVSLDLSLHLTSQVDRQVPSLENKPEPDNCIHLASSVTVSLDTVNDMPNCIGEVNKDINTSLADSGIESIVADIFPEEFNLPNSKHAKELRNVRRSDDSERIGEHDIALSKGSLAREVSDTEDGYSSRKDMNPLLHISLKPVMASQLTAESSENNEKYIFQVVKDSTAHMDSVDKRSNITSKMRLKDHLSCGMQLGATGTEYVEETLTDVKSCLPQGTPSKYEREKNNQKHENGTNYVAEGLTAVPSKLVGNELHANGVLRKNSIDITSNAGLDVSCNSILRLTSRIDTVPLKGSCTQKGTLLENLTETEKAIHIPRSDPVSLDMKDSIYRMPNCLEDTNSESFECSADLGIESGLVRNVSDMKDTNSLIPLEISRKPVIAISPRASDSKEKVCRRSSRFASILLPEILATDGNSEFRVPKDCTASISSVHMSVTSDVGLDESLTEPLGRRDRSMKLKVFQKDQQCVECMNSRSCMHRTPSKPHESAGNEKCQTKLDMPGKSICGATDDMFSIENNTMPIKRRSTTQSVVRKLYYITRSGRLVGSSTNESQSLDERENERMENVEDIPATDATSVSRTTKSKNQGGVDQTIRSLKAETNGDRVVRVDHSFVKTVNDGKYKRRNLSACDLATTRAVYFTHESSATKLQIDPAPTSDTEGGGLTDEQISVNTGHESEFLKSTNANTTQSDTIMGIHSSQEKILDLSINKIQNNQSKRGRKKKQSPLSVSNFTHESPAMKLQIDPAPTSDTEGGGLTDEQISVNTGHESEFLKSTNANTTQADTIMGIHSSKEKILDLGINKIQNHQSKRGRKKKQSPLSESNFTHESSATKLQIDPAPTSDTEGGGLTDEQISVNTGHESEFLKSTNANTTRSDTIMGIHSSKEKILDLSINKIQNHQSKRGWKKKQSPLSVSNFAHESSATKLQINHAPTSDTEGGGLTDEQISVNTGHESEFLKSTTTNTTQSDTIMGIHSSKEILDLSINKTQNNQSKRGRKKKQSSLSVSNFAHESSATKLQIDPTPTSDIEGGGLTDEQISGNTGHESEFLKSTNANTTQSDTIMGIHSSKKKILDLDINKIQNNQSKQGRKNKQSPLSVSNFAHESSATELQINPAPTSDTEGGGLTDEQISVNTGHESEFLKSTNTNTTQSHTIMGIHSSKEKILDLSINKIQNNQSKRGRKKKQSPLSVSNFAHESSAMKLQMNPAPTSDIEGGGLTDEQISVNTGHESEFLKSTNANTTQSDTIVGIHSSKEKILDLSINKIQNNQSKRGRKKKQSPVSDNQYPLTRDTAKKLCIASPELLNLKRSRSGRLLVPPIAQWCQKIIYAANGEITAITGEGLENFPCIESQSEPLRKRKRLV